MIVSATSVPARPEAPGAREGGKARIAYPKKPAPGVPRAAHAGRSRMSWQTSISPETKPASQYAR